MFFLHLMTIIPPQSESLLIGFPTDQLLDYKIIFCLCHLIYILSCYSKGGWVGFAKENICLAQEDMKMGELVNL